MKTSSLALAFVAFVPFTAPAAGLSYSHVDLGYVSADAGGATVDGISLDLSYRFSDPWYGVLGYADVEDSSTLRIGGGWRTPLRQDFDLFVEAALLSVEYGPFSDDGFMAGVGLRAMVSPAVELNGRVDMVDVGGGSDSSLTVGGVYHLEKVGFIAEFSSDDAADAILFGVRIKF